MICAVGSTNPVKITAVSTIIQRAWPNGVVKGISVPSGVSEMPMSDDACILGAKNRAVAARDALQAEFGFGLEGGVHPWTDGLLLVGWVAVVDKNGRFGIGGTGRLPLPHHISQRVLAGEELGPVMDDILQTHNIKQKGGAVGALTANLKDRQDAFELGVAYALGQFVAHDLYEPSQNVVCDLIPRGH